MDFYYTESRRIIFIGAFIIQLYLDTARRYFDELKSSAIDILG